MANQNKKIKTDASGVYDSGFSGAPAGSGRGSFEPKGKGFGHCRDYKAKAKQKVSSASVYDPTGGLQEPSNRGIYK